MNKKARRQDRSIRNGFFSDFFAKIMGTERGSSIEDAKELFESWYQRKCDRIIGEEIPWPDHGDKIKVEGMLIQIDYRSNKWHRNSTTKYWHPIEKLEPLIGSFMYLGKKHPLVLGAQFARPEGLIDNEDIEDAKIGKLPPPPENCVKLGDLTRICYIKPNGDVVELLFNDTELLAGAEGIYLYILEKSSNSIQW